MLLSEDRWSLHRVISSELNTNVASSDQTLYKKVSRLIEKEGGRIFPLASRGYENERNGRNTTKIII